MSRVIVAAMLLIETLSFNGKNFATQIVTLVTFRQFNWCRQHI
jgi:hypothetical protein